MSLQKGPFALANAMEVANGERPPLVGDLSEVPSAEALQRRRTFFHQPKVDWFQSFFDLVKQSEKSGK